MGNEYRMKPASQQEALLYLLIGESVCTIQHVEDALSHSIVLKMSRPRIKSEADQLLEKYRSFTLGKAVTISEKEGLYPEPLTNKLRGLLFERNWLIHKSVAQNRDGWDLNISRDKLMGRIKTIIIQAHNILRLIEEDLIKYSEENGVDMSQVKSEIKKYYFE